MTMPVNLVLVRHGESEGNIANKKSRKGDNSVFEQEGFNNRHSASFRLTDRGINEQVKPTGAWLRQHYPKGFDRHYVSLYIRAMETALELDLPNARWYEEPHLRERDWGDLDIMPDDKRRKLYQKTIEARPLNPLAWRPPNGETLFDVKDRIDRLIQTLHRECANMSVIVVCHGETMWMLRYILERLTEQRFLELDSDKSQLAKINNCQILEYTRRNPHDPAAPLAQRLSWFRSVCAWDEARSPNTWTPIIRPSHSNEDLRHIVEKYPRIVGK